MKKTLLLCFIHGFKGGDDTFGAKSEFAQHLAALISAELPKVDVRAITYPKYETRGDLFECVGRFRDWLLEKVIDLEVANGTPSPTVDPSVRTILVGHSMGGIVAAETAISLASERTLRRSSGGSGGYDSEGEELSGLMFPYIQGVLAFDTPYLGISPGVIAHNAEVHYNTASAALNQLGALTDMIWGSGSNDTAKQPAADTKKKPNGALPAPQQKKPSSPRGSRSSSEKPRSNRNSGSSKSNSNSNNNNNNNAGSSTAGSGGWGNWGKYAVYAGAAGALAMGGAAAYFGREHITTGWSWVSSHLEFVGCLGRGEELKARVSNMVRLNEELGVGFANLYTRLGKAAASKQVSMVGTVMGNERTFCVLPSTKQASGVWKAAINDKATDEPGAHMSMFEPKDNPGYSKLSEDAKNLVVSWTKNEWYEASGRETEYIEYQRHDWRGGGGYEGYRA
ncbi:hypothetical protein F4775DRAFT_534268 [Biscogniauxia sp. FL1348]|nr:hypothetical protein F4775DRAFT_534268 [Biscogniauxia sp. FL1348]